MSTNPHNLKVLLVTNSYPPVLGGLQTVVHGLAQYLMVAGHQVQVVTNRYPRLLPPSDELDGVPIQRYSFLNPRLEYLRHGRPDLFLAGLYYALRTPWKFSSLVRSFQPDVINFHYPHAQLGAVLALKQRYDLPLVLSLHGDDILPAVPEAKSKRNRGGLAKQLSSVLKVADQVTACSAWLLGQASKIEAAVSAKGHVIHNGIDLARFEQKDPHQHPRPYLLAFGRLSYQKGFDRLLEAFSVWRARFPMVDLILVGEGEQGNELREMCRDLHITERVIFYGRATPPEVVRLLNGCLFAVVPSRWEPFGITALEAMAARKPVMVTRTGGLPEFVRGSGTATVENTTDSLIAGLGEWLPHPPQVGPDRDQIVAQYAWQHRFQAYERILTEVVN